MSAVSRTLDDLTLGSGIKLEDLVDREAMGEMLASVGDLLEVPLRVFSEDGKLIAEAVRELPFFAHVSHSLPVRSGIDQVIGTVKRRPLSPGDHVVEACVTGAFYAVTALSYDQRCVGRLVIGPYVQPGIETPPEGLYQLDAALDRDQVASLFRELPRASEESVRRIARHVASMLDLVLFSEHRALLSSNMHLASVREGYRELQERNVKLQTAYDRLKDLDRLKSNFLATVSHELRTPLTSIIGYSEMLVEGLAGALSPEQHEFVQTIREKGEQLLGLIKSLLDLSKLESGTMSLTKAATEPAAVVRDVVTTMQPHAKKKGVVLERRVPTALPEIWADAERLRQVLVNLVENAIKFTPTGGTVVLEARVASMQRTQESGEGMAILGAQRPAVEFRVADTGIGIPEAERERVFDAFYQVDSGSTREQGGTGLGLSIVKRLVDGHDGRVRIEDNAPQGTVFVVVIPARRSSVS